ncbi:MAG TPA: hypothetical protein VND64_35080 [Pirellulales bacterium]|nr:hypothetical protein [Pirellulales bacterium]
MGPNSEPDELEQALAARPRADPSAELRRRVRMLVRGELRRPTLLGGWSFAAELAAAMLLWINLSWSATGETACNLATPPDADSWAMFAQQIEQVAPELSPREVRRQALVLSAGANLTSAALASPLAIPRPGPF